jgi:hypothetical protein
MGPVLYGPPQNLTQGQASIQGSGLSFFTANFPALGGIQLPFNMVGADPTLGASTTTIQTVLVPLKFVFPPIAGNAAPAFDASGVISAIVNSPIFKNAQYTAGSTDLGNTQFGDALQRAQFWNLPGFSKDYHVLLGAPTVAPSVTFTVASGQGNAYQTSTYLVGIIRSSVFSSLLTPLLANYSANQLVIFVTDSVYLSADGTNWLYYFRFPQLSVRSG